MRTSFSLMLVLSILPSLAIAQQWPAFRADNARSGLVDVDIRSEGLTEAWKWKSELPPDPAWDGPARWDAFSQIRDLPAMRQYDAAFHPVSDGESVFFGSSSQDILTALNLETGQQRWSFVAGGPIRLAPTLDGDRVLFGCDDGNAYCVDRRTGHLVWKFNPSLKQSADQRRLINNDRLISYFPVRTGITVRDGIAYFGASFLPWRQSYICAIDATTGKLNDAKSTFVVQHKDATLEGSLLVAEDRLIVPQGRVAPLLFNRTNGKSLGSLPGGGGITIVLTDEGEVIRTEGGSAARSGQVGVFRGKERVASFPRGRSIVVSGDTFYVIDGQKLFAAVRETNELRWTRDVDEPLELIMAGGTLFVGGKDHVTAVNSGNGTVLWSAETEGRVFGLAVAGQRLIASTDSGVVHVYQQTAINPDSVAAKTEAPKEWKSPPVTRVREKTLLHRWVFHRSAMKNRDKSDVESPSVSQVYVTDQASGVDLKLSGTAKMIQVGDSKSVEAIELSGGIFPLTQQAAAGLPDNSITVESWVRVDQTQEWGGIAGCIQDDGATEHGWLLGYRSDKFCLAIAAGGSGLTYATANESFEPKTWNHVVGTYNGRETRLYVNGSLAASTDKESGPISYADKRFFTVGAYRDLNENFPLLGALHEVRVYSAALTASDVARLYNVKAREFDVQTAPKSKANDFVTIGPYSRYVRPGEVEISYSTKSRVPSVVNVIVEDQVKRVVNKAKSTNHKLVVKGLGVRRELQFQILDRDSDKARASESYSLDSHFDWSTDDAGTRSAEIDALITQSPNPRGLVFVIGSDNADQAQRLASETEYRVLLIVEQDAEAEKIRQRWAADEETVYGRDLNVVCVSVDQLPAASAAIVVAKKNDAEVRRLVRPAGGLLFDGESVVWKRDPVEGSGVWSHMYGTADNSAFGGEQLSNASNREDLITQWIGRPGPRYQTDRQNRKPSPLAAGGRLFLQGQQRMIALDSYSGSVLWSVESPTVMRWNVPHDCSNWCADSDGVFVAAEHQAWFIDGKSGEVQRRFDIPVNASSAEGKSWGFISRYEDQLLGSVVDSGAIYTKWWGKSQWFDSTGGADTHVVAGEKLFSMNPKSGKLQWTYDGLVIHPTITILDGHIIFLEDVNASHLENKVRRISLEKGQKYQVVCLDVKTGKRKWDRPAPPFAGHVASLYLAGGGDEKHRSLVLVASESTRKEFVVHAFDPTSGKPKWNKAVAWEATHHGKHISRPAIQGELMYLRPEVLSLADGKTIHRGFPGGHGCSSYTLSTNGLFSRLGETTWWDVRTQKVNRFKRIRTDCWISVVPAQGMLLSAEGGGGCSCGTWLETSLGFLPRSVDEAKPDK